MSVQGVTGTTTINVADPSTFESSLTPDALMVYLSSRLNGLDDQVNNIFNQQKAAQQMQEGVHKLQAAVSKLHDDATSDDGGTDLPPEIKAEMVAALAEMDKADPVATQSIREKLYGSGFVLSDGNDKYNGGEVKATASYLQDLG